MHPLRTVLSSNLYSRDEPDYNGWSEFETFRHGNAWFWSACDEHGDHKGYREGPFASEEDAYLAALDAG